MSNRLINYTVKWNGISPFCFWLETVYGMLFPHYKIKFLVSAGNKEKVENPIYDKQADSPAQKSSSQIPF